MSWSLNASGHVDPEAQDKLARDLGNVLSAAGPAVSHATFSSNSFNGDPRTLVEPEPVSGDEPE